MGNFFAELKRRHIYRVGAAYVVVAWALTQGIAILAQVFMLPSWIAQAVIVLLAIGLPVALVAVWMIESRPHEAVASAVRSKPTIVDWTLCGALAVVLLFMGYQQIAPSSDARVARPSVDAAKEAAASRETAISLAVLPFANLSGDPSQEFFSDGITEEITFALARVPDLRVVARTSAYQFRDQNRDIRSIGQQLNATHFIEGSVRKAGDRVRITAQLIRADDATHVWAETFDRELTDIFAIQEDIATAIAGALRMPLGLQPGETLVSLRPKDEGTYELFLRGRAALRARSIPEAVGLLEQVVARDPSFAAGWRFLASARGSEAIQRSNRNEEPKAYSESNETLARRAIALAPNYAGGYSLLADLAMFEGKWLEAMDLHKRALALDPDDPEVLGAYWNQVWTLGYLKEALDTAERIHLLEPLVPVWNFLRARTLAANGMVDIGLRDWLPIRRRGENTPFLASAYAQLGRFEDAADVLLERDSQAGNQAQIEAAAQVLRAAASKSEPPARLPEFGLGLNFIYAYTRAPDRMLDLPEKAVKEKPEGWTRVLRDVSWQAPSSVRKTERFKTLVRDAGVVDYWRERGWPDLCRPVGANDFTCE